MTTTPSYPEYESLLEDATHAARLDGRFANPAILEACHAIRRSNDWRIAVLGHHEARTLVEVHMLVLADQRDLNPPPPDWLAQTRTTETERKAQQKRVSDEWHATREQEWRAIVDALPVPVKVAYNYSGRNHCDLYLSGAYHILAGEPIHASRFRRPGGYTNASVFCAHKGKRLDCQQSISEQPPTCSTCIRRACTITDLAAPTLLEKNPPRDAGLR